MEVSPPSRNCQFEPSHPQQRGLGGQPTKHTVPELGRNLRKRAWEQIVKDWEQPDPSRSLFVAMKNWDSTFFKSKAEEVKFGQRQLIALEFIDVCVHFSNVGGSQSLDISYSRYNRDRDHFLQDYPEANVSFSALLRAVRARRQANGECQLRRKRAG
jgi:hypothetical protein